jgi:hypothetical protein
MVNKIMALFFLLMFWVGNLKAQGNCESHDMLVKLFGDCWRIRDTKFEDIVALSDMQIKGFRKRGLCFDHDQMEMVIDTIFYPKFTINKYDAKKYLWDHFNFSPNYVGISTDSLTEVIIKGFSSLNKRVAYTREYSLFYDGYYLFMFEDGVMFRLYKPMKNVQRGSGH